MKSTYSLARIRSTSLLGNAGKPGPIGVSNCPCPEPAVSLLPEPSPPPLEPEKVRRPSAASSSGEWAPPAYHHQNPSLCICKQYMYCPPYISCSRGYPSCREDIAPSLFFFFFLLRGHCPLSICSGVNAPYTLALESVSPLFCNPACTPLFLLATAPSILALGPLHLSIPALGPLHPSILALGPLHPSILALGPLPPLFLLWGHCTPLFLLCGHCTPLFSLWGHCTPLFSLWGYCTPLFLLWGHCPPSILALGPLHPSILALGPLHPFIPAPGALPLYSISVGPLLPLMRRGGGEQQQQKKQKQKQKQNQQQRFVR